MRLRRQCAAHRARCVLSAQSLPHSVRQFPPFSSGLASPLPLRRLLASCLQSAQPKTKGTNDGYTEIRRTVKRKELRRFMSYRSAVQTILQVCIWNCTCHVPSIDGSPKQGQIEEQSFLEHMYYATSDEGSNEGTNSIYFIRKCINASGGQSVPGSRS